MSSISIIAIITALIMGSFILSGISYTRQQALKKRNMIIKLLQQQADEALSYISILLRVDKEYILILQLQDLVVSALSNALRLNSEDRITQSNLAAQKIKLDEYTQNKRNNEITNWLTSITELTSIQTQLAHLNKLLDLYRNKGNLSLTKYQELQNHLNDLRQKLSFNSYLYQADLCGEQNNITSYQLFIKQAIQVLKKSNIDNSEKNQKIKELSDRIQEVKRTGRTNEFENFIKPNETSASDNNKFTNISE